MPIIEAQWSQALDPIIHHWFEVGMGMRAPLAPSLFNVQTSGNSDEQIGGIGGMSVDVWDNLANAGQIGQVDFNKGYIKTYTHVEKAVELQIERKFLDDNKYPQITAAARRLGENAIRKRENDGASVFNNAFSDTFAGADAVGLCSLVHPASPDAAGSTQANEGTLALTKNNVRTTREAMMAFTDDKGNKLAITPDILLVPPALEDDALPIAQSLLDPSSANNAINPMAGRLQVVTWHFLTDSNAWFLIDSVQMKQSLDWFDRVPLGINMKVQDNTLSSVWIAYMRYSYGWSDWRWIYGQNPS